MPITNPKIVDQKLIDDMVKKYSTAEENYKVNIIIENICPGILLDKKSELGHFSLPSNTLILASQNDSTESEKYKNSQDRVVVLKHTAYPLVVFVKKDTLIPIIEGPYSKIIQALEDPVELEKYNSWNKDNEGKDDVYYSIGSHSFNYSNLLSKNTLTKCGCDIWAATANKGHGSSDSHGHSHGHGHGDGHGDGDEHSHEHSNISHLILQK